MLDDFFAKDLVDLLARDKLQSWILDLLVKTLFTCIIGLSLAHGTAIPTDDEQLLELSSQIAQLLRLERESISTLVVDHLQSSGLTSDIGVKVSVVLGHALFQLIFEGT